MAKARARTTARKVKDKWRAKNWYQIHAPKLFDEIVVAETLAEKPELLTNRITEVSMQTITNDFRKSHIKLYFKINNIQDSKALTVFDGHTLTSDYIRRMVRRRKSRVDGVYDIETRDGARIRVKPLAITDKRIQTSQKKLIRNTMKDTIIKEGKAKTLNELLRDIFDGKIGSEIYKNCKTCYPVKRIEVFKTELIQQPTIQIEEKKPEKTKEQTKTEETTEKPEKKESKPTKKEKEKPTTQTPQEKTALKTTKKTSKSTKKTTTKTTTKKKTSPKQEKPKK